MTITLCAVIGGAESWSDIELFGQCKYNWFKSFLQLPNGIPSHDTFARVFARIDPEQLEKCVPSRRSRLKSDRAQLLKNFVGVEIFSVYG